MRIGTVLHPAVLLAFSDGYGNPVAPTRHPPTGSDKKALVETASSNASVKKKVLLVGATGFLGAKILRNLALDASVTGSSHTVRRALLTPRPPFARYRETIARVIADLESDRKKSPVGTDSLSQQPAEKSPVESDPARTGPTPE